jgi:predicted DNA binding CopG/RHH family protein
MAKRNAAVEDTAEPQQNKRQASASKTETDATGNEERASRSTMFTFRLPREELAALERAASEAGLTVAEFVRKSIAMRPTTSVLAKPQVDVSVSVPYFQYGTLATWSEAQTGLTPFHPTTEVMH